METSHLLIIVLVVLLVILLLIIGGLVFYIFQQTKSAKNNTDKKEDSTQEILKSLINKSKEEPKKVVALCAVCEKELAEEDDLEIDKLHFCKEHYDTYIQNKWTSITNQRTTADTPEAGIYIYNFKNDMWNKEQEPCFIQCEYKIDVNNDHIETYVQLYVREEKSEELKRRLESSKNG
jgi:hypothetical protein